MTGMRIGIVLPIEEVGGVAPPYALIREMAVAAEAGGLDSLWVYDHLLFQFDGVESGLHECWTILAAVADATSRVALGTLVMCTAFRSPAVLAKMAATLDLVSEGRLILGIGAGWHDPEFERFGFPTDHKVSRFDEAFTIIRDLIRTGRADLDGTYVQARDAFLRPPARADLPILVAAKGPRMLELTARHADAWNLAWFGLPNERLARVRGELADACERVGRDPSTLAITVGVNVRRDIQFDPVHHAPNDGQIALHEFVFIAGDGTGILIHLPSAGRDGFHAGEGGGGGVHRGHGLTVG